MYRKILPGIIVLTIILTAFAAFSISGLLKNFNPGAAEPEELDGVQIDEYEGEQLSQIWNLHENSIKGPQEVDITTYRLEVDGLVSSPASYRYDEVIDAYVHYKKVIRLNCVEGWSVNFLWEGLLVRDLLQAAGPLPEANTIIFHAEDGYTTSFPIEYVTDNDVLLAYRINEVTIPMQFGYPFQLAAESKWGYKWIKWVTRIELSDDVEYKGTWESAGYSNSGNLDESFFERRSFFD